MLVITGDTNSYKIETSKELKDILNKYNQINGTQLFSETVTSSLDNLCNKMVEAFHKTEQMNEDKISKINESMLNKTMNAFHKTEQMNEDKIKHMIESFSDNKKDEERFERIEAQMNNISIIHQNMQMDFLKNKNESLET